MAINKNTRGLAPVQPQGILSAPPRAIPRPMPTELQKGQKGYRMQNRMEDPNLDPAKRAEYERRTAMLKQSGRYGQPMGQGQQGQMQESNAQGSFQRQDPNMPQPFAPMSPQGMPNVPQYGNMQNVAQGQGQQFGGAVPQVYNYQQGQSVPNRVPPMQRPQPMQNPPQMQNLSGQFAGNNFQDQNQMQQIGANFGMKPFYRN